MNNPARYSDEDLFDMLRGDSRTREAAFKELYTRHSGRVYMYCRKIIGAPSAADDAFQQTFLLFLRSAQTERRMTNVPGFLLRIARNICLNIKKQHAQIVLPIEELDLAVEDLSLEAKELARLVTMALDLLPEEYKEVFVLQAYNGLSYKEIAEVIDAPVSTVRNRVVRAKRKLREILSPYLHDYRH